MMYEQSYPTRDFLSDVIYVSVKQIPLLQEIYFAYAKPLWYGRIFPCCIREDLHFQMQIHQF